MRLVIIGSGFAGMYAALSSARLREIQGVSPATLEIILVAPEPTLVVRPRLYEQKPETLTAPLQDVLKAIDVGYVQGRADTIDTKARTVEIVTLNGGRKALSYDRLVIATGSRLFRPNIPGLAEYGFSVDQLDDAIALDRHLQDLASRPPINGRDTVVVAGGGFTGIEAATEMPARLRAILGKNATPRVIIVDRNNAIAPDMGEGPRPIIVEALHKLGVETRLGTGVASLDKTGVTLSNGDRIEAETVIWAAGMPTAFRRASSSWVLQRAVRAPTAASHSARWATRATLVAKRGSSASSGASSTWVTSARQPLSFCTPISISPSLVGNLPYGAIALWLTPMRAGCLPVCI